MVIVREFAETKDAQAMNAKLKEWYTCRQKHNEKNTSRSCIHGIWQWQKGSKTKQVELVVILTIMDGIGLQKNIVLRRLAIGPMGRDETHPGFLNVKCENLFYTASSLPLGEPTPEIDPYWRRSHYWQARVRRDRRNLLLWDSRAPTADSVGERGGAR